MAEPKHDLPHRPERIGGLAGIATNLFWSWSRDARALFRAVDRNALVSDATQSHRAVAARRPLDVFGYAAVRREERRLIPWYTALVEGALERLDRDTYPLVVEIAQLPDGIRGYEEIKLNNARVVRERAGTLMERLRGAKAPVAARS
jgi:hypothetical protein